MQCGKCSNCKGFCPITLGLAFGITCGIFMIFYAWAAMWFGWGTAIVDQYSSVYYGFGPTIVGGLIGGLWGLLKGFVFGVIFAILYNLFTHCKKCCGMCGNQESCKK
jgi:hypothetical protein